MRTLFRRTDYNWGFFAVVEWLRVEVGFASDLEWTVREAPVGKRHVLAGIHWSTLKSRYPDRERVGFTVTFVLGPLMLKVGVVEP